MALNQVVLMGRITHDLETKQTQSGITSLRFTVACDRYSKSEDKQTDFINCVAYRSTAEFIGRYFGKGRMIAITGSLHTYSYEGSDGVKRYVTEVIADKAEFTGEPKPSQNAQDGAYSGAYPQGQTNAPTQQNAPQAGAQPTQQANPNGYPSPYMYAPPREQPAQPSDGMADFEVFSEDGVPF